MSVGMYPSDVRDNSHTSLGHLQVAFQAVDL
jgi:hypothetical protein